MAQVRITAVDGSGLPVGPALGSGTYLEGDAGGQYGYGTTPQGPYSFMFTTWVVPA